MTRRPFAAATSLAALGLLLTATEVPARALSYAPVLAHCYDAVLDARFDAAEADLAQACGPAPPETCELIRTTELWWRIQLDPYSRALDSQFRQRIDADIDRIDRWTTRDPRRADAWFFLGAAYGLRVQFRVLRGERLPAALDGKRIKDALERALAIDPALQDAYFGIGLYHYYAAIAPTALRLLRWMLFLPGGDREQGLREMLRARDHGELLRGETDYQLHLVDLWYEHKPGEALELLDGLRTRYPHNPVFAAEAATVQAVYLHDHAASRDTWRSLLDLAIHGQVGAAQLIEVRARLGLAGELDALFETDLAVEEYRHVADARPAAPYGAAAQGEVGLGRAYDRLGLRDQALAAYQAALAAAPPDDPQGVRALAREGLAHRPDARQAEAYHLSIEGWRALQRHALAQAADSLHRSAALNPGDPVTRFRLASLLAATGHRTEALAAFEGLAALRPAPPPTILGASYLEAGRLLEAGANRVRAAEMYGRAAHVPGADADTKRAATQAAERLRSQDPAR